MMRSLYSGVSGLKNHQTRMDVIGNNIANVNTTGFKGGRVTFQDMLSQSIVGASSPQGAMGGTNPQQIGLGVGISSIDTIMTDGSVQATGKNTDLCISNSGFFVVSDGLKDYYTRNGGFEFDKQGNYILPGSGMHVKGWMADENGTVNSTGEITNIVVPAGQTMGATATTTVKYSKNLSVDADMPKITNKKETLANPLTVAEVADAVAEAVKGGAVADADGFGYTMIATKPDGTVLETHVVYGNTVKPTTQTLKDPYATQTELQTAIAAAVTAAESLPGTTAIAEGNGYTVTTVKANGQVERKHVDYSESVAGGGYDTAMTTVATYKAGTAGAGVPANVNLATQALAEATVVARIAAENAKPNTSAIANGSLGYTVTTLKADGTYSQQKFEYSPTNGVYNQLATTPTTYNEVLGTPGATNPTTTLSKGAIAAEALALNIPNQVAVLDASGEGYTVTTLDPATGLFTKKQISYSETVPNGGYDKGTTATFTINPTAGTAVSSTVNLVTAKVVSDAVKQEVAVANALPNTVAVEDTDGLGYTVTTIAADGTISNKHMGYAPGATTADPYVITTTTSPFAESAYTTKNSETTSTPANSTVVSSFAAFDTEGVKHEIVGTFAKTDKPNEWTYTLAEKTSTGRPMAGGPYTVTFYEDGTLKKVDPVTPVTFAPEEASPMSVKLDFSAITQYAGDSTAAVTEKDGNAAGTLEGVNIDSRGTVIGSFSNGLKKDLARVALATFNNPSGLTKDGNSLYTQSNNSGEVQINVAGAGGAGTITPSSIEMSNVNLSDQFSDMIITQRGFQSNSKIITVSDEMIETLVNLKR